MKYIFFGTPTFAAIILEKLINAGYPPKVVVCNPDKPVGRKHVLTAPAVKNRIMNYELGIRNKIKILQPDKLERNIFNILNSKFDFAVVAAYGKIIPKNIIDSFSKGFIGVHPSLLPKFRGPSPIQQAILDGEKETGVSLYLIDEKVDNGPILATNKIQITSSDTYTILEEKLARMAGELLVGILPKYAENKIKATEQDHAKATFTKKFITEDGLVDLSKDDPEMIARKIRALNPEPGVYTIQNGLPAQAGKRLKLLEVKIFDGKWIITKTQLEGKKPKEVKISLDANI